MSEVLKTKPPVWFWIVVSLLMIWNVMGIVSWSSDAFFPEEMLDQYSPEQQALFAERPGWIMPVYAVAVFGAFFGTIMMLRQSRLAMPLFVISLIAVLIQFGYVLFIMDAIGKLGFAA